MHIQKTIVLTKVSILTVSLVCPKSCRGNFLADRGCPNAEVFVWGRGEYGRLGLGDRSGSSKLRATQVHFREPDIKIVQVLELPPFAWKPSGVPCSLTE